MSRILMPRRVPLGLVGLLGLLGLWVVAVEGGLVDEKWLPGPGALAAHTWSLITDGYRGTPLATHVLVSIRRTAIGFLLAVLTGVPIGLAMGRYCPVGALLGPVFALLRPIPPIAFIPLAVLYLGLGESSKILLIFLAPFMFIVLNAEAGVRSVSASWIRAGQMLGFSRRQMFTRVILPGSLPSIMVGVRTGAAVSWALVVAAELISAQEGLGYMVASAGNFFDLKTVYAGIFLIGIIGFLLDIAARQAEKRLLHWQGR
ncbi:ABC transporter permease [Actinomadura chibensis]|uniref:ABC transporter permease n=1 Tax=Actinomadura chibensis TaxID=392828 RepID=A0A5D0NBU8_9ACTN|nr:ABC transporter permease [Actinomadura chibensis]TYB41862.1 ABC transporter permease [Actinomadura chibensis]